MKTALYASALCLALVGTAAQAEPAQNASNSAPSNAATAGTTGEHIWFQDATFLPSASTVSREQVLKELAAAQKTGDYAGAAGERH